MLVLTRKPAECIRIGDNIVIKVIKTTRGAVKIGIDAPAEIRVVRGELLEQKPAEAAPEPVSTLHPLQGRVLSDQFPHVA